MPATSKEANVILALEALQNDENLTVAAAAKIYNIDRSTLRRRRASKPVRYDIPANLRNLMDLEEQTIVQYMDKLYTRVFPPRLSNIEDIAN